VSDRLLTLSQAADALNCSTSTLKRRVASGELIVFRDGRRLVRVREADLRRYIAEHLSRPATPPANGKAGVTSTKRGRLWE
jgi:excisionase family DNA binding protein